MRIKKFVGRDVKSAVEQMKQELGSEAIVLHTRKLAKGGLMGTLGKDLIEITGAIDEEVDLKQTTYSLKGRQESARDSGDTFESLLKKTGIQMPAEEQAGSSNGTLDGIRRVASHFEKRRTETARELPAEARDVAEIFHLRAEVEDIRSTMTEIAQELKQKSIPSMPEQLRGAYAALVEQEMNEKLAADLTKRVSKAVPQGQLDKKNVLDQQFLSLIAGGVKTGIVPRPKTRRPRVVALVGPTGAGKTTTIAKLAAIEKYTNRQKVALITVDTFRIGAIEQLRTFASIAEIPMEVVYRPGDMPAAMKKFSDRDIIFIDTVGRNQRAKKDLAELKRLVEASKPDEVHLVLSAATSGRTLADVVEKFKILRPNHIIFSKIDEAATFGPLFNIAHSDGARVSYLTTGQGVPEDIVPADGIKFASLVYRGVMPNA